MGNCLKTYICTGFGEMTLTQKKIKNDPEENKEPPMRSKSQFSVKPNSFKALPQQDCLSSWPPYSLVKEVNKHRICLHTSF